MAWVQILALPPASSLALGKLKPPEASVSSRGWYECQLEDRLKHKARCWQPSSLLPGPGEPFKLQQERKEPRELPVSPARFC